jgi:hypothetical protein
MTQPSDTHGGETHGGKMSCSRCLAETALSLSDSAMTAGEFVQALRFAEVAFLFGSAGNADGRVCRWHEEHPYVRLPGPDAE